LDFFIGKQSSLLKRDGVAEEDFVTAFELLIELHCEAVRSCQEGDSNRREFELLHLLYRHGKRAGTSRANLDSIAFDPLTKESLHFMVTSRKLLREVNTPLDKTGLALFEKLSNELCQQELKTMIAQIINVDVDSLLSFSEKVYVKAKILVFDHILKAG